MDGSVVRSEGDTNLRLYRLLSRLPPNEKTKLLGKLEKKVSIPMTFRVYPDIFISQCSRVLRFSFCPVKDTYVLEEEFRKREEEFPLDFRSSLVFSGGKLTLMRDGKSVKVLEGIERFKYLSNGVSYIGRETSFEFVDEELRKISCPDTTFNLDSPTRGNYLLSVDEEEILHVFTLRPFEEVARIEYIAFAIFVGEHIVVLSVLGKRKKKLQLWKMKGKETFNCNNKPLDDIDDFIFSPYSIGALSESTFFICNQGKVGTTLWDISKGRLSVIQTFHETFIPFRLGDDMFVSGGQNVYRPIRDSSGEYGKSQSLPYGEKSLGYPSREKRRQVARMLMTSQTEIPLDLVEIVVGFCVENIRQETAMTFVD